MTNSAKAPKKAEEPEYPEHRKLEAVQEQSQACGDFLHWLRSDKGIVFASIHKDHTDDCYIQKGWGQQRICGAAKGGLVPAFLPSTERLLAEFFSLDLDRLDAEKRAMLDALRKANTDETS